jgi:predicted Zn-dependent protease with MMP-like domain
MDIPRNQFEKIVAAVIDDLPDKIREKINNAAIFIEDFPSPEQMKKVHIRNKYGLFGLFEGYAQAKKINFGPVLPDRITIFRVPICSAYENRADCVRQIESTVRHEIAHHFGSDEKGAAKAGRRKP